MVRWAPHRNSTSRPTEKVGHNNSSEPDDPSHTNEGLFCVSNAESKMFPNHCLFRHLQWSKTLSLCLLSLILLTAKIMIDHDHQVTVSESTVNIDIILRVCLV